MSHASNPTAISRIVQWTPIGGLPLRTRIHGLSNSRWRSRSFFSRTEPRLTHYVFNIALSRRWLAYSHYQHHILRTIPHHSVSHPLRPTHHAPLGHNHLHDLHSPSPIRPTIVEPHHDQLSTRAHRPPTTQWIHVRINVRTLCGTNLSEEENYGEWKLFGQWLQVFCLGGL